MKCSVIGCEYESVTIVGGNALCPFHYELEAQEHLKKLEANKEKTETKDVQDNKLNLEDEED